MKLCEKCRTENNDEAAYCLNCGNILETGKTHQVVKFQMTFLKLNMIARSSFRVLIVAFPMLVSPGIMLGYFFDLKWRISDQYEKEYAKISDLIPEDKFFEFSWVNDIGYESVQEALIQYIGYAKADPLIKLSNRYEDAKSNIDLFGVLTIIFGILLISLPLLIGSFLIFNLRWKKFYLNNRFNDAKGVLTSFAFAQNKTEENVKINENAKGELKLKDKSLGAKGYFHLVTDKGGNVLLIGEKYNTQNLIRKVFGKDINFIEK